MQVILETPDAADIAHAAYATDTAQHDQSLRRIRSAMRSLSWLVLQARVKLSHGSTPGAIDKRCEVELITEDGEPVVVTSMARDWHSAMHSALARASRSLLHRWQQQQQRAGAGPRRMVSA